jgi:hypothetical protein
VDLKITGTFVGEQRLAYSIITPSFATTEAVPGRAPRLHMFGGRVSPVGFGVLLHVLPFDRTLKGGLLNNTIVLLVDSSALHVLG